MPIPRKPQLQILALAVCILSLAVYANADLTHRYSFTDATTVKDSVGKIDGKLVGGATVADGKLTLQNDGKNSGDDGVQYVEFAQPLLPAKGSASIVVWSTTNNIGSFSRILDIGDQQEGEGQAFIYITPRDGDDQSRGAITASDAGSKTNIDNDRIDDGKEHMIALVIDGDAGKLHAYIDGKESKGAEDLGQNVLDSVKQKHAWLGRSAFDSDPGLTGSIEELRIYDNALSADDVAAAFKTGPKNLPASTQPSAAP
jgi:hypothetical protein